MILSLMLAALAQAAPATPAATPPAPPPAGRMMDLRTADTNGDGIVTRQESLARADALFARMDTDRNGTVSADERKAATADGGSPQGGRRGGMDDGDLTAARMREMAGRRFDRVDANGDGKLDAAELAAAPTGPRGDRRRDDGNR